MMYVVHLKDRKRGKVEVEASNEFEAMRLAKRMLAKKEVPTSAWEESTVVVTFAEPKV